MKRVYEMKSYLSSFKEEVAAIDITCNDPSISTMERLRKIAVDLIGINPEEIEFDDEKMTSKVADFASERKNQIHEIRQLLDYYDDIYEKINRTMRIATAIATKVSR